MEPELKTFVASLRLGEAQTYKHILIMPLTGTGGGGLPYLTLNQALGSQELTVTEVSQGGSVPELKVINRAGQPVLLLDGEELLGAKQNRVLNASILLRESSETVIPVSCTEQGRWAYASAAFHSSDVVMAHKARTRKTSSVTASLYAQAKHYSDQRAVWHEIDQLHAKAGTSSPTGAMQDVFKAREEELATAMQTFKPVAGQTGLLVLVDGEVVGFDVVSSPHAYAQLHSKLLKSYLIDALVEKKDVRLETGQAAEKARAFLDETTQCEEKRFPSIGYGTDCRFTKANLAGVALVHEGQVVHSAFFRIPPADEGGRMASLHHRRRWSST